MVQQTGPEMAEVLMKMAENANRHWIYVFKYSYSYLRVLFSSWMTNEISTNYYNIYFYYTSLYKHFESIFNKLFFVITWSLFLLMWAKDIMHIITHWSNARFSNLLFFYFFIVIYFFLLGKLSIPITHWLSAISIYHICFKETFQYLFSQ